MEGVLGSIVAISGAVGGFLAPILRETLSNRKLKQRAEMLELIDSKINQMRTDVKADINDMKDKMATKDYINDLIQILKQ